MTETKVEKLKLMVVDDEPDNLDLLYRTFRRDFHVYKANHARKALEILAQEGEMAVIISDQRMPEMNGTEFLSLTVEKFPDTIRILLTGFTDVEDLVEAINSGQVFKYITKPWNPERLKNLVEQATDTYRLVKKRTHELRRSLRRESLFNAVTTAIRESLDYESMLQKIAATIGQTFEATCCLLKPVENNRLTANQFYYRNPAYNLPDSAFDPTTLIAQVLETGHYQIAQDIYNDNPCNYLVVPLSYQQHLLAVLALYQWGREHPWQDEDIQLITGVAEQAALAVSQAKLYQRLQEKQQQISAELEVARQIQNNLLRQTLPDIKSAKLQACCYPAREVGGDFFEIFVHPTKGDVWLAVGDVSGKGVPAALFMASAISVLRRELAQEIPAEPNVVIHNLNHALCDDLISNNCFITFVLARYTPTTRELVYANAGHIYPLVWSNQTAPEKPNYLTVRGIPLGILPKWQAKSGSLILAPGDTLLLASDGITEAMVSNSLFETVKTVGGVQPATHSMLNQDGLWQLLQKEPQPLSLNHLLSRIQADNHVQEDDQTILSLEVL
ncbi:Response regulator receiver (CheY) and GAF modulated Serine phosphatase [Trichormus variabilis ATCC 29413]|uniref:Response regulator receiver (CheY) and GAF modulated Serine phosphatase n=2 Tax=Anabaena variabilis TaxID=264691 RepID=Q3MFF0_TRIV2|nr:SpoIIE family protein phosphatase [Trichormus variabilis]ABA20286.1 Response regulator receiver (CheY) and GAF modulated Serine phosphatase [Trichormus variabilis ATCC 29413]MBC1212736.1 SpoIIE family protein phosphatase [Trichormus variabilis ARAD]MBC1257866.1 SpoIIE family protein phosphatase [Trichormus variabilis V5]MBC1269238.1 SpoIIE family protein phosphatase [Trichormus variabilis FSR]MBC1304246.1 SpoIIE family protein phosphatase [Trichormus variabilis N2B]